MNIPSQTGAARRKRYVPVLELLEERRLFSVELVKDIDALPLASFVPPTAPSPPLPIGKVAYFAQTQGSQDAELWKTDGTSDGTVLVKDIRPGYRPSWPTSFAAAGNNLLFTATRWPDDPFFLSNGTDAGTFPLTNIQHAWTAQITKPLTVGSRAFFPANDGVHGRELWVSDGTVAGTHLVSDLNPGTNGSTITTWGTDGSRLFFQTAEQSQALMVSDGTPAGTHRVGTDAISVSSPIFPYAGGVVFAGGSGVLWSSDGVTNSKLLTKEPTELHYHLDAAIDVGGGELYVSVSGPGTNGRNSLYRYDPQTLFTQVQAGTLNANSPTLVTLCDGAIYFRNSGPVGTPLYRVPVGGTVATKISQETSDLTVVNGTLYFQALDNNGTALWKVTSATAAPERIVYLQPKGSTYTPQGFASLGNLLLFTNYDASTGWEVWKSDGTASGTTYIKDANASTGSSSPSELTPFLDKALFGANDGIHGTELWISDGTAGGTKMLKDINPGAANSHPTGFVIDGDKAYFRASDALGGAELWVTDGSEAGTHRVKDINPGSAGGGVYDLTVIGSILYFAANDGVHGNELWRSDGTDQGTYPFGEAPPGTGYTAIDRITPSPDGGILFAANDGVHGLALWRADAATGGAVMLKDIDTSPANGLYSKIGPMARSGNLMLFAAYDPEHGSELWRTDGTAEGTMLVADLYPGTFSSLQGSNPELIAYHGFVYFIALQPETGGVLFRSDGTAAGTSLVNAISPFGSSVAPHFRVANDRLIFATGNVTTDGPYWQIYSSDGTTAGTFPVLAPGVVSDIQSNAVVGGRVVFVTGRGGLKGSQLWSADGTPAGTSFVTSMKGALSESGFGQPVALANGTALFAASDGVLGVELWRMNDVWAPTVRSTAFEPEPAPSAIFNFNEDVGASLTAEDLTLQNVDTGQPVTGANVVLKFDQATEQAVFSFSGLPDGHYRAVLPGAGVTDQAGNAMAKDAVCNFTIMSADTIGAGAADFSDLVVLAQNYDTTGKTFTQGDFNDDGDVDFDDLVLLAQRYTSSPPAAGAATDAATGGLSSPADRSVASRARDARKDLFSTVELTRSVGAKHSIPARPVQKPVRRFAGGLTRR
jgi:ELWxxDGT repeat protein